MSLSYAVTFRGFSACPCLATWLPVFERVLIARGVVRESIDIAQLIGGAEASGGTHASGGAFDIWQHDPITQQVAREMGAAAWNRIPPWWTGSPHTHGVLNGCPHNAPARYQITALANDGNGLGKGGMGGSDYGPGPRHLRTWREGITWAQAQEDDMPYTEQQLTKIIRAAVREENRAFREGERNRFRKLRDLIKRRSKSIDADLGDVLDALADDEK